MACFLKACLLFLGRMIFAGRDVEQLVEMAVAEIGCEHEWKAEQPPPGTEEKAINKQQDPDGPADRLVCLSHVALKFHRRVLKLSHLIASL